MSDLRVCNLTWKKKSFLRSAEQRQPDAWQVCACVQVQFYWLTASAGDWLERCRPKYYLQRFEPFGLLHMRSFGTLCHCCKRGRDYLEEEKVMSCSSQLSSIWIQLWHSQIWAQHTSSFFHLISSGSVAGPTGFRWWDCNCTANRSRSQMQSREEEQHSNGLPTVVCSLIVWRHLFIKSHDIDMLGSSTHLPYSSIQLSPKQDSVT